MTKLKKTLRLQRALRNERELNKSLGKVAAEVGPSKASKFFDVSRSKANYWKYKTIFPGWKPGTHGGVRTGFTPIVEYEICRALRQAVESLPTATVKLLCYQIYLQTNHTVSPTYVKTVLALADWTYVNLSGRRQNHDLPN